MGPEPRRYWSTAARPAVSSTRAAAWRATANASSATLSAKGRGWIQVFFVNRLLCYLYCVDKSLVHAMVRQNNAAFRRKQVDFSVGCGDVPVWTSLNMCVIHWRCSVFMLLCLFGIINIISNDMIPAGHVQCSSKNFHITFTTLLHYLVKFEKQNIQLMQRMTSSFLQQSYLLLSIFHHPLCHSLFHSWLKTSFSANPSHRSLSFSSSGFTTWIPQTVYCYFWAYSVVYFLVFFCFYTF